MLPTPETVNLPPTVYPPSEDSYLLLDTLSAPSEISFLSSRFPASGPSPVILEVGTGSGIVLAFITAHSRHILGRSDVVSLGVDLNRDACVAASTTARLACQDRESSISGFSTSPSSTSGPVSKKPGAGIFLDAVQCDLTSAVRGRSVDVLIFNPPYVPTDAVPDRPAGDDEHERDDEHEHEPAPQLSAFERESLYLDVAVAGGPEGMQVTGRLLAQLDAVLSAGGAAYVLLSVRNRPRDVADRLAGQGWRVRVAGSSGRKGGIEKLVVLRIARPAGAETGQFHP